MGKKVFDSAIDPIVVKMDNEEKQKLAEELNKAKSSLLSKSSDGAKTAKPSTPTVPKHKKGSFLAKIIYFFKHLFSKKKDPLQSAQKQLKSIAERLANTSPPIYEPQFKRVTSSFCYTLYNLYSVFMAIRNIFDTYNVNKILDMKRFFVEYFFNKEAKENANKLTREGIEEEFKLFNEEIAQKNIKNYTTKLEDYISNNIKLLSQKIKPINVIFYILQKDLIAFSKFFKYNDKNFDEQANKKPILNNIALEVVETPLKYIDSIVSSIDVPINIEQLNNVVDAYFKMLARKIYNIEGGEREFKSIEEGYSKLKDFIKNIFINLNKFAYFFKKSRAISDLIRLAMKNVAYMPASENYSNIAINWYINYIGDFAKNYVDQILRNIRARKLHDTIIDLFGSEEMLMSVAGYDENTNNLLSIQEVNTFTSVMAIKLIKSFIHNFYTKYGKPVINSIIVEGEFLDKSISKLFADNYYKLEDLIEDLKDFEMQVHPQNGADGKKISNYLASGDTSITKRNVINNVIVRINNWADELSRSIATTFSNIAEVLDLLLGDYKSSKPQYILNIKSIGKMGNREFLAMLDTFVRAIRKFNDIIRNFTVIEKEVRDVL